MAKVTLTHIQKVYKEGTQAVRDVSFSIEDREFVVIVGPSGCGKTTLLRMIAGLEEITAGELQIDHKIVNDLPPNKREIAMVFQNYALYPHMTAYENMAFGLKIKKVNREDIKQRIDRAAAILNIEDLLTKKPGKMSGGQRQRIAIGRAIVRNPKVFLFDEPLSNLDAKLRGKMRMEIAKLHRELQATMVYVTHDQVEAMTLGDRIVVLNQGEVMQIASPMELFLKPANKFVAEFIGNPPMNFLPGRIESINDNFQFVSPEGRYDWPDFDNRPMQLKSPLDVDLGIRPEDLQATKEGLQAPVQMIGQIDSVELLGSEKIVYAHTEQGLELTARLRADVVTNPGSQLIVYFDLKKAHLFDQTSGKRVEI